MKYFLFLLAIVISINFYSQSTGSCFAPAVNYTVNPGLGPFGAEPFGVSSADFNNDGLNDIAVANSTSNDVSVFIGSGAGQFNQPLSYHVISPISIVTNDFNNDGETDLGVASGDGAVAILFGLGNGVFDSTVYFSTGAIYPNALGITTADYNSDGNADIAVTNNGSHNISVLLGIGSGNFAAAIIYPTSYEPFSIISKDFDNDGGIDLMVSHPSLESVSYLKGNGDGTFQSIISFTTNAIGYGPIGLAAADFNNDGKLDLATANSAGFFSILIGANSGLFLPAVNYTYTVNPLPWYIVAEDFNGDGKIDLATSNTNTYDVYVMQGNGLGGFMQPVIYPVGLTPLGLAVNDFNNDGKLDIATANAESDDISILLSSASQPISAVSSSSVICNGTSVVFTANGASNYIWNTGTTSYSTTVSPNTTITYSVIGTNACETTSAVVTIAVDPTCQDVWPGDANSDGIADNLDVLELGLHYTQTGPPRASTSNTWQSYFANNWTGTITNGKNLNHSDCNGDGTINDNDTLAIYNNYGLTHAFKPVQTNTVNPQLSIVPDQSAVTKGSWGTSSIYLGDATTNINNINGLAFTIDFDNTLIETNSIYIDYQNSFLDSGQNLKFRKLDFANSKLFTATTHTLNNNVSGNGKIATLYYQIKSTLTSDQVLSLGISQANQSDAAGVIAPLTSGTATLMALGTSVGLQELNNNIVSISPNPTNGSLTINSKTELQKIEVISITGQVLINETPTNVSHILHLQNFANGIYFVNVYQNNRVVKREKIVLSK